MKNHRKSKKQAKSVMKDMLKSSPFATKRSTNRKLLLITPLSVAGATAAASWFNRRYKADPKLLLARGANKLAQQIDKSKEIIDLRDHEPLAESLDQTSGSLRQLSSDLQHAAMVGSHSRTPVSAGV